MRIKVEVKGHDGLVIRACEFTLRFMSNGRPNIVGSLHFWAAVVQTIIAGNTVSLYRLDRYPGRR